MTDRFTNMVKKIPIKGSFTAEVAQQFVRHWVFDHRQPVNLLADNGEAFTAKFFQDVGKLIKIHNNHAATYHRQANGQVKSCNHAMLAAVRTHVADHPRKCDQYIDAFTYAYNWEPHTLTSIAPFELTLSKPPSPLPLIPKPSDRQDPANVKRMWKFWSERGIRDTKGSPETS